MGLFNWLKKEKNLVKENVAYDQVVGTGKEIRNVATFLLNPKRIIEGAKVETFEEAQARLKVSDIDLEKNRRNFAIISYISVLFALGCFGGALYYLIADKNILGGIAMLSIMLLCLANTMKYSFRAFQLQHRVLCSVAEWYQSGQWLPKI